MSSASATVLIMAAGTGGHVFPALSIARCLHDSGVDVQWLGTPAGMENDLLTATPYTLHRVPVSGLRGAGLKSKLMAPYMIFKAFLHSRRVMRTVRPACVMGMGGFVCGPAGLAARASGIPLLIHEQNAVAGLTNRLLARLSQRVLEAFPGTFPASSRVRYVGNPVRVEIAALFEQPRQPVHRYRPLRILVLGGSQGARAINTLIPEILANWDGERPELWHQTGARNLDATESLYASLGVDRDEKCRVVPFIEDMAGAYMWADVVVARSGASTVSEIAVAGLPSILVPYPYHRDQQQVFNARWLADSNAAYLVEQRDLTAKLLLTRLRDLHEKRMVLDQMSRAARRLAVVDAAEDIAQECRRFVHGTV